MSSAVVRIICTPSGKEISIPTDLLVPFDTIQNIMKDVCDDDAPITPPVELGELSGAIAYANVLHAVLKHMGINPETLKESLRVISISVIALFNSKVFKYLANTNFPTLSTMKIPVLQIPEGITEDVESDMVMKFVNELNTKDVYEKADDEEKLGLDLRRKYQGILRALDSLGADLAYQCMHEHIASRLMRHATMATKPIMDRIHDEKMWLGNPLLSEEERKYATSKDYMFSSLVESSVVLNAYDFEFVESLENEALKEECKSRAFVYHDANIKYLIQLGLIVADNDSVFTYPIENIKAWIDTFAKEDAFNFTPVLYGHTLQPEIEINLDEYYKLPNGSAAIATNNTNAQ